MPTFEIETIERWEYGVRYRVDAATIEDAARKILAGDVEYTSAELRERSPRQEVHRLLRVTDEDTGKVIESERRLKRLLRQRL
ncbi:MAG TPA: hypothetical protein VGL38_05970 [bacterium]|jgi:hypothetical protein